MGSFGISQIQRVEEMQVYEGKPCEARWVVSSFNNNFWAKPLTPYPVCKVLMVVIKITDVLNTCVWQEALCQTSFYMVQYPTIGYSKYTMQ